MSKRFLIGDEAKEKVLMGVSKLHAAVSSTLGPGGRHVAIHRGLTHVTKDGVTVANALTLKDDAENIGANIIKNVTGKMAWEAGDGTTTATVLAAHMIKQLQKMLKNEANPIHLKEGMDTALDFVVKFIKANTIEIDADDKKLEDIATISANHDSVIGKLIAEAIRKVGAEGIVDVEKGQESETKLEIKEGMLVEKGFFSPYFITNVNTGKAEYNNAIVMLYAGKMDNINMLLPILETAKMEKLPLVIIAEDFESMLANTLVMNKLQQGLPVVLIQSPGFATSKIDALEDIAAFIDGKVIGAETGIALDEISDLTELGIVDKITVGEKETIFIKNTKNEKRVQDRIDHLSTAEKVEKKAQDKASYKKRISKLNGAAVTIKVGGNSEMEIHEQGDRLDDALSAAKCAVKDGVVAGGGTVYYSAIKGLKKLIGDLYRDGGDEDIKMGMEVIMDALVAPIAQIVKNTGQSIEVVKNELDKSPEVNFGYDAKNKKFGNMFDLHVIDPAKVAKLAIESATSVAKIFLTLDCIIIDDDVETTK